MGKKGFISVVISMIFCGALLIIGYLRWNEQSVDVEAMINRSKEEEEAKRLESSTEENSLIEDRGTIVYSPMGDSLTEGYFASASNKRFVEVYASMLEEQLGYVVDVKGVAGYGGTTTNGVQGLSDVVAQNPDLITIEFGTNDADPQNGSDIDTFKANLDLMIETVSNINGKTPTIVLVTTWNQGDQAIPFDEAIIAAGEKYGLPVANISDIWQDSVNKGPEGVETFLGTSDNWHPNDAGMQEIAERIYDVSQDILQ